MRRSCRAGGAVRGCVVAVRGAGVRRRTVRVPLGPFRAHLGNLVRPALADGDQGVSGSAGWRAVRRGAARRGRTPAGRPCPVLDLRGELPAEVDRIDQAGVQRYSEDVGGVAGQQDAAGLVQRLPAVPDQSGQPPRVGHRQVAAEDPPEAGAQFVEGHRSAQVDGGVVLAGVDDEDAAAAFCRVRSAARASRCLAGCGLAP